MKTPPNNKVLLFTGPSGSGKTTCLNALISTMPETFAFLRSFTTRPPRPEEDPRAYNFVDDSTFDDLDLLQETHFDNYRYGTTRLQYDMALELNMFPTLAVTEDQVQAFIDNDFHPIVIRLSPYNFTPRPGREEADATRPPLPPSITLFDITYDATAPQHTRLARMYEQLFHIIQKI